MGTFKNLISKYGFSGLVAFLKIKSGRTRAIKLVTLTHSFRLRPGTSDITTFKHIFAHGDYALEITPGPQVIIDAGANIGLAAIYFANRFPRAKIISVELSPQNFNLLTENTAPYHQISPIHAGLWPRHEALKFKQEGISPWGYKVDNSLVENVVTVNSITINDIIAQYQLTTIDLLKIDIEGAEVELFSQNYEQWLPQVRMIIIEFHDRWRPESSKTVKAVLSQNNFREQGTIGENNVFVNTELP